MLILASGDPYSFVEVRGAVTITRDGGPELIQQLSQLYMGKPYTADEGTDNVRVVLRLTPEHVVAHRSIARADPKRDRRGPGRK